MITLISTHFVGKKPESPIPGQLKLNLYPDTPLASSNRDNQPPEFDRFDKNPLEPRSRDDDNHLGRGCRND